MNSIFTNQELIKKFKSDTTGNLVVRYRTDVLAPNWEYMDTYVEFFEYFSKNRSWRRVQCS